MGGKKYALRLAFKRPNRALVQALVSDERGRREQQNINILLFLTKLPILIE